MIRKLLLPTLALLVFASCSNKMSLVKRKYNKGFYVNVSKKNNGEQIVKESAASKTKTIKALPKESSQEIANIENVVAESMAATQIPAVNSVSKTNHAKNHSAVTASAYSNEKTLVHHFIKPLKTTHLMKVSYAAKTDSNKIIQIILALFPILCLIAVYLHDNGVTLNFWITLLLHLTFIGAMIFALLVVLDVVNLA